MYHLGNPHRDAEQTRIRSAPGARRINLYRRRRASQRWPSSSSSSSSVNAVGERCRVSTGQLRADRSSSARTEATSVVALYSASSSRPRTTLAPYTPSRSSPLKVAFSSRRRGMTAATAVSDLPSALCSCGAPELGSSSSWVTRVNATSSRASALDAGSDAVACTSVECGMGSNGVERQSTLDCASWRERGVTGRPCGRSREWVVACAGK